MNKLTTKINTLYFSTLAILAVTLIIAWKTIFIPFVLDSEKVKADLFLTPYTHMFEEIIEAQNFDELDALISSMLLLKDEESQQPLILGVNLELSNGKNVNQANENRTTLFTNSAALFSPVTFELLGSVEIRFNDFTYNKIKNRSNYVIAITIIIFTLLFVFGQRLLAHFIRPLSTLSDFLSDMETLNIDRVDLTNKGSSTEIQKVWNATQIMLSRIRKREKELNDEHQIVQKALREKLEAEDANKAKTQFLSNMSHEIRTPLTSIIGFADSLLDKKIPEQKREDATNTIIRNGKHLLEIINDILDLSKIESDKLTLENIDVSPLEIVEEIESVFRPLIVEKNLSLEVNYSFPLPRKITSDPTRIRQILYNLLSNARKFTERGRIQLNIEFDRKNNLLIMKISDTGIGLAIEDAETIFNPFSQADASTSRKYGGTGLGLSISRKLARLLGGDLVLTSNSLNKKTSGSEFILTINSGAVSEFYDKMPAHSSTNTKEDNADTSILNGKILIAEDTKDIQALVSFYLKQTSASITFANNGREAVQLATDNEYDLILMDMQMPELDGISATKELRDAGYRKPIIALTANVMREEREQYKASGLDDFIAKPIDKQQLYSVIYQHLTKNSRLAKMSKDEKSTRRFEINKKLAQRFISSLPE
ncbi:MAG: response regulator, partial [Gammaproteobacteria bacterium]|nr:response regulator [Gammaproteobacteria bacterium]